MTIANEIGKNFTAILTEIIVKFFPILLIRACLSADNLNY